LYLKYIGHYLPRKFSADTLDELQALAYDEYSSDYLRDRTSAPKQGSFYFPKRSKTTVRKGTHSWATINPFSPLDDELEDEKEILDPPVRKVVTPSGQLVKCKKPTVVEYLAPYLSKVFDNFEPDPLTVIELELTYADSWEEVQCVIYRPQYDSLPDSVLEYHKKVDSEFETPFVKFQLHQLAQRPAMGDFATYDRDSVRAREHPPKGVTRRYTLGSHFLREKMSQAICGRAFPPYLTTEELRFRVIEKAVRTDPDFANEIKHLLNTEQLRASTDFQGFATLVSRMMQAGSGINRKEPPGAGRRTGRRQGNTGRN